MKNIIIIASLLLGMPLMAQTKVVKKNAVKANNFGITYSLPKTSLVVDAEVTKVTCKAGPYYQICREVSRRKGCGHGRQGLFRSRKNQSDQPGITRCG